ncbi:MAG TPA: DUF1345 domain-containing protein [Chloroflexia bacterium]|nr:DUF1345 domain-containing protein [Chloroflexia bacterium]
MLAIIYALLPESLTVGPSWILLPVIPLVLIPLVITRTMGMHDTTRVIALTGITLFTLFIIGSVINLVLSLPAHTRGAVVLLRDAMLIWLSNVIIFASWYWEIDGGGPALRHKERHVTGDFLFPQMVPGGPGGEKWSPEFIDYLFLAFNTSTAFSPTDTAVLTRRAKVLMMLQSSISLVVIGVLVARAINIL